VLTIGLRNFNILAISTLPLVIALLSVVFATTLEATLDGPVLYLDFFKSDDLFEW